MFQIETALLKFDAMMDGQSEKGSVVKRYVVANTSHMSFLR